MIYDLASERVAQKGEFWDRRQVNSPTSPISSRSIVTKSGLVILWLKTYNPTTFLSANALNALPYVGRRGWWQDYHLLCSPCSQNCYPGSNNSFNSSSPSMKTWKLDIYKAKNHFGIPGELIFFLLFKLVLNKHDLEANDSHCHPNRERSKVCTCPMKTNWNLDALSS